METTIKIDKRLYDDISQYCTAVGKNVDEYCAKVLREKLALDKYGDLNDKVEKKAKKTKKDRKEETDVVTAPPTVEETKEDLKLPKAIPPVMITVPNEEVPAIPINERHFEEVSPLSRYFLPEGVGEETQEKKSKHRTLKSK